MCRLFGNGEQRKERNDEPGVDRLKQRRQRIRKISDNKKRMRIGCGSMVGSERCVSCTTFNILAPIYKRLSEEVSGRFPFFVSSLPFAFFALNLFDFWSSMFDRIRAAGRASTERIG